nr:hypothetical protein [Tanacetum cinerariifolium]
GVKWCEGIGCCGGSYGGGAARGGEWYKGSDRSGDGKHFWFWPKDSPENFSGDGGGRRWSWPTDGGRSGVKWCEGSGGCSGSYGGRAARGGEWYKGSDRSGDGKHFWF